MWIVAVVSLITKYPLSVLRTLWMQTVEADVLTPNFTSIHHNSWRMVFFKARSVCCGAHTPPTPYNVVPF